MACGKQFKMTEAKPGISKIVREWLDVVGNEDTKYVRQEWSLIYFLNSVPFREESFYLSLK